MYHTNRTIASMAPGRCDCKQKWVIFKFTLRIDIFEHFPWNYHQVNVTKRHRWLINSGSCTVVVRQQGITWANVDLNLFRDLTMLDHNELKPKQFNCFFLLFSALAYNPAFGIRPRIWIAQDWGYRTSYLIICHHKLCNTFTWQQKPSKLC